MTECDHAAWKEEQEELNRILSEFEGQKGVLIPAIQKVQDYYGYLPERGLKKIAETFNMPASKVFGVATFYAQFHLSPRGRWIIRVCLGTACHVRGAERILERVISEIGISSGETTEDLRFTIEPVACIGCCGLAPVLMINEYTHGRLTPDQIPEILEKYE